MFITFRTSNGIKLRSEYVNLKFASQIFIGADTYVRIYYRKHVDRPTTVG